jgi:hypothetical protein
MPYVIITRDKPNSIDLRTKTREEHLKYIEPFAPRVLAGGGFLTENDTLAGGGMIVLDVENRSEVEAFVQNDPYTKVGLFQDVEIKRWKKVFFAGEKTL